MLLLYYVGLLPFIPIPEKFFMCFLPTIINRYPQGHHLPSSSSPGPQLLLSSEKYFLCLKPHCIGPQTSPRCPQDNPQGALKTVVLIQHS